MTETRAAARTYCNQHHQPLSDCEDWDRHNHSMRFREDDWRSAQEAGPDTTTFLTQAANAALGYVRCRRGACMTDAPPVPVVFGDLTGKTLGEWIAQAVKQAESQHPRHEPVMIGAASPGHVVPATPEPLLRARARTRPGAAPVPPCSWSRAANRTSPPSRKSRTTASRRGGRRGEQGHDDTAGR